MEAELDGTQSLKEQENSLNFIEKAKNWKLTGLSVLKNPPSPLKNIATFQGAALGESYPELFLIKIPVAAQEPVILSQQQAAGKTHVCTATIYVRSALGIVAAFR